MYNNEKEIDIGYYWILIHPIFEEGWTIGYYDGSSWLLHGLEGKQEWLLIDEVGDRIPEPPEKINYT